MLRATACVWLLVALAPACAPQPAGDTPLGPRQWRAQWIWGPAPLDAPHAFLRGAFQVEGEVASAWIQMTGDDGFSLHLNGEKVLDGGFQWNRVHALDVTRRLRPGRNLLAAQLRNYAQPGGLLLQLDMKYADGRTAQFVTNSSWRFSEQEADGWRALDFDDSSWAPARELGPPPVGPWGHLPLRELVDPDPIALKSADLPQHATALFFTGTEEDAERLLRAAQPPSE